MVWFYGSLHADLYIRHFSKTEISDFEANTAARILPLRSWTRTSILRADFNIDVILLFLFEFSFFF